MANWLQIVRNYIGKNGGTEVATGKSIVDALGHDGTTLTDVGIYGAVKDLLTDNADSITEKLGGYDGGADVEGDVFQALGVTIASNSLTFQTAAVKTVVDDINSDVGTLTNTGGTATLGAIIGDVANVSIASRLGTINSTVSNINSDIDDGTTGLIAIKTAINAIQSTVNGIQNNTRLTSSLPNEIDTPTAGSTATKFFLNIYDTGGAMEDPDSNIVAVVVTNAAGTDRTARLYKDAALTTALDTQSGGTFDTLKKLEKDSTGRYYAFYKCDNADTLEFLNFNFKFEETAVLAQHDRGVTIVEELGDAGALEATLTSMKGGGFVSGTDSLEAISDAIAALSIPTAAAIADAVWDEATAGHVTAGTFGKLSADTYTLLQTVDGKVDVIDGYMDVPTADSVTNVVMRDVIGNKSDTVAGTSIVGILKSVKAAVIEIPSETNSKTFNATALASINAEVDTALSDIKLNKFINASITLATDVANNSLAARMLSKTAIASTFDHTTDSLEAISDKIDALVSEQPPVKTPITVSVTTTETTLLDLSVASHIYFLDHFRFKSATPGANTMTVRLYEEVNNVSTVIDTFIVDSTNFGTYQSLMDMFGLDNVSGGIVKITGQMSAGAGVAVTAQAVYIDHTV